MSIHHQPLKSLKEGRWFKLICGASYQHLPAIRNLALAYGLAGADCIDVAADPAVVEAVIGAFQVISELKQTEELALYTGGSFPKELPLLMVSFSDGEDPHFRKAVFDATACPADCSRPCESICPASAITFTNDFSGVIEDRCYGCGRCLPVCPIHHVNTVTRATVPAAIAPQLLHRVNAVELHTQVGRHSAFMSLWATIQPHLADLTLISISCPDHNDVIDYLWQIYDEIQPLPIPLIWQTDGRSMSGDIGKGTTHATIKLAQKVLQFGPPGFVQLAGGTNTHTVAKLHELPTVSGVHTTFPQALAQESGNRRPTFGGIAYGSYARRLMHPLLDKLPLTQSDFASASEAPTRAKHHATDYLEASPTHLMQAIRIAQSLVGTLKTIQSTRSLPSLQSAGTRVPMPVETLSSRCHDPSPFE